jgi:exodeoxyribonuclease V alpha subunit
MAALINWTPLGCGAKAMGFSAGGPVDDPEFPCDFIARIEQLDLGFEAVFLAWEIARLAGRDFGRIKQRALMLLVLAAQLSSNEGSTRLPLTDGGYLDRTLNEFKTSEEEREVIGNLLYEAQQICSGLAGSDLADIFGGPGQYRPLIIDHGCIYMQKLHVLEARVGRLLWERINSETAGEYIERGDGSPGEMIDAALGHIFKYPPMGPSQKIELDSEQKEAVRAALSGRITIVSGRPGSGKTSIVASLLRVLARVGSPPLESIALAAPTGKAADRMLQSIRNHLAQIPDAGEADRRLAENCPSSSTLHRLLRYSPGQERFWHNENNPLSEQLVIVDESSMIDLAMMDRLLRAMGPETRVVFLGVADQLPSIEAGAVLRDLCRSETANEKGRVVVLKKSYRAREEDSSGRKILDVAAAINAGTSPADAGEEKAPTVRKQVSELSFAGVEHLLPGDENQRLAFFTKWHDLLRTGLPDLDKHLSEEYKAGPAGFDDETTRALRLVINHFERFRMLCVTRVTAGGTGAEAVNAWFHRQWSDDLQNSGMATGGRHFLVGEPVMVTRNSYNLSLYNGDSGLILLVAAVDSTKLRKRPAEPMAVFPRGGGFVAYPLEALSGRLELAWASTVHKAQGSEYDNVAILLPGVPVRPLTRELLYTAVTRAKNSVVIVGTGEVLEAGVKRAMERASGLADMLG